jgi:hypothetical protein
MNKSLSEILFFVDVVKTSLKYQQKRFYIATNESQAICAEKVFVLIFVWLW